MRLFVLGRQAKLKLVNLPAVRGNYYVVDRLFTRRRGLRLGTRNQTIVRNNPQMSRGAVACPAMFFGG